MVTLVFILVIKMLPNMYSENELQNRVTAIKKVPCVHVRVYLCMRTHAHAFIKPEKHTPNVKQWGYGGCLYCS